MNCRVPNVYVVICFIRDACLLCTSHLMCHPHPLKPHPTPPRAWPGESGDNHLIFTSLCFPGGWGEHSLICVARVHISSFRNALLGLVRGFQKGCHSRFYTGDFGLQSPKGRGLHVVFLPRCPGTSLAFTLSLSQMIGALVSSLLTYLFSLSVLHQPANLPVFPEPFLIEIQFVFLYEQHSCLSLETITKIIRTMLFTAAEQTECNRSVDVFEHWLMAENKTLAVI